MALHTLGDIRDTVMTLAGMDTTDTQLQGVVNTFINHVYADVCASFDWDWMRLETGVVMVPASTAPTGTIAASGVSITGSSTAFDSSNIGSYIQLLPLQKESHRIIAVTSPTAMTVETTISQDVDSGSSYMIFTPDYILSEQIDVSSIKFIINTNKTLRLEYTPEILLERYFANEGSIAMSDTPRYWCSLGATGGYPIIRMFPIPTQYVYLKIAAVKETPELVTSNDTPLIPMRYQEVLEHGALSLVYNWHGRADLAAFYKQEYEQTLKQMIRADNTRATYAFPKEPNDLPKPRLRKFILRLPGAYGGNVLD